MTTAEEQFIQYTEPYKAYGDKILLKIDHTLRVRDLCADLAGSTGAGPEDIETASVCGLLHDVGRFEQWKRYGTYNDSRSVDHGDLGAELLQENDWIRTFTERDHGTILKAVKYHNKYQVPDDLSDREKYFANVTRDADKLDILYSFAVGELTSRTGNTAMSGDVFRALLEKRGIRNREIVTRADVLAIRLAFVYDLHFKRSFEILKENDSVNRMISRFQEESGNEALKSQLEVMRENIRSCLEEKLRA